MIGEPGGAPVRGLREVALRGAFWTTLQQVADHGIRLPVYLVLARLLAAEAFGLVALAAVFVELLQLFRNQGLTAAIIQRERIEPAHLDSAFWGNLALGGTLAGVGFAGAGVLARIAGQPELEPILRWLSIAFVLSGLSAVQDALLRRELRFKALAVRSVVGQTVAGLVAIALAFAGFGVWSLVALLLVFDTVGVALLWSASSWRPRPRFSWPHYRELLGFGIGILGVNVIRFARTKADSFLIGVFLGATSLGYYAVIRQLVDGLWALVVHSVTPVLWSTLSRLQTEPARLARAVYQAAEMLALVSWPVFLGAAAVAPELVSLVLGERWAASAPILPALAVAAIARSASVLKLTAIAAIGETVRRVGMELLVALITLGAIVAALPWGLVAVAWAHAAALFLIMPYQVRLALRLLGLDRRAYLEAYRIPVLGSLVMLGVVLAARAVLAGALVDRLLLAVTVALGAVAYAIFVRLAAPALTRRALENLGTALRPSGRAGSA